VLDHVLPRSTTLARQDVRPIPRAHIYPHRILVPTRLPPRWLDSLLGYSRRSGAPSHHLQTPRRQAQSMVRASTSASAPETGSSTSRSILQARDSDGDRRPTPENIVS